jgi:CBS domain-containing protein
MPDPQLHLHPGPTARDIMTTHLVTLAPTSSIFSAIRTLLKHRISGAPVIDADGKCVGMFSELDCLRVLAAGEFYSDDHREEGVVGDYMTSLYKSLDPDKDIYTVAQYFLTHSVRRLPVLEEGELIGQVSRRDVLAAMEELGKKRASRRRYPDYRKPAGDVGAKRS